LKIFGEEMVNKMQQILRSIACLSSYFSIIKHLQAPEVMSVQQLSIRFALLFSKYFKHTLLPFFEHKKKTITAKFST